MYEIGIIGGMGPDSSRELLARIIRYTDTKSDQEHIPVCLLNLPNIPDRTDAILNGGESPVPMLNRAIRDLIKLGVKRYILCCNTAHYFLPELISDKSIELIDMVGETVALLKNKGIKAVVVLGTAGTSAGGVYTRALASAGIEAIEIKKAWQDEVSRIIYGIKSGGEPAEHAYRLISVLGALATDHPGVPFLLACTELSLLKELVFKGFKLIDPLDVAAIRAIQYSGYRVKPEWLKLVG